MDRLDRARTLVLSALEAVEREIATPRHKLRPQELGTCRETLRGYLEAIDKGALPPRRERGEGLGRIVMDSWPFDLDLGNLVLQAERAWRNA
ncbi:MAG TPA: hypothetical protein VIV57_24750 [Anaeromyxobacter sp.]